MALKSELMAVGMPGSQANRLGYEPIASFTAAGSSQATATTLTSNSASVTTSAAGNGVILGSYEQKFSVFNIGPFTCAVYPPVGGTFTGLAVNAPVTVAANTSAWFEGGGASGIAWCVS
jgi:hypothetical protein